MIRLYVIQFVGMMMTNRMGYWYGYRNGRVAR